MAPRASAGALALATNGAFSVPTEDFDMRDMNEAVPLAGLLLIAVMLLASQATVGAARLIA